MAGPEELQEVFRFAASTLGERVLRGRRLRWKPGIKDTLINQIKAAKGAVDDERNKLRASGAATTTPTTRPRSNAVIGGHRAPTWTAAKPSAMRPRSGVEASGHRQGNNSAFGDGANAVLRLGAVGGVTELLNEGANGGLDMLLDPTGSFAAPTFEAGYQAAAGPVAGFAISNIASIVKDSGLIDGMLIEMGTEIATEVASCLPVIGAVVSLGQAAMQSINAIIAEYKAVKLRRSAKHITPGQPEAALQAVRTLYDRRAAEAGVRAGIGWVAGGLQVGGLFADFGAVTGPLLGIVKAILNLTITIISTCLVLWEMRQGNKIIAAGGPFDVALLGKSPILGTYLLTEAESSTLYAFLVSGPLSPTWQDEVERMMPKIESVIRSANSIQRSSPFMLEGFDPSGARAKGDHFLDTRIHKSAQRFAYEAKIVTQRDPRALRFLSKHMKETVLGKLPSFGRS